MGAATPKFYLLATNVSDGTIAAFTDGGIIPSVRDPADENFGMDLIDAGLVRIKLGVACSAAFPGFFRPLSILNQQILQGPGIGGHG